MLVPLLHRLIVKPEKAEEVDEVVRRAVASGLIVELDKRQQAAVEVGVVISIGNTAYRDYNTEVAPVVGDKVYYAKYAGKKVKDGQDEYLILNDEDLVAIIKE